MRIFLILSLLFSAAICASLNQQSKESDLKERTSLLLRDSKDVGPEKLNRWLSKVEVLNGCTNSVYDEPEGGIISSPNYPGSYLDYLNCTYLIDLRASADNVRLQFLDFQMENGWDYVTVYDGPSVGSRVLLNVSGTSIPGPVSSTTGQMLVTFNTDSNLSGYKGFLATYTNGGPTGCGKTYTEITENITSLYYPDRYPDNLDCQYKIDLRSSGASSVNLTFSDFNLDSADRVLVYEGLTTSGKLLLNATGSTIPRPVWTGSSTPQMLVRFTTFNGSSGNSRGFFATYLGF